MKPQDQAVKKYGDKKTTLLPFEIPVLITFQGDRNKPSVEGVD